MIVLRVIDSLRNIRRLLIDRRQHRACLCVKTVLASGVSDLPDGITNDLRDIDVSLCGDLTHDQNHSGGRAGLAGYTAHRILPHQFIQYRIRYGIAHLVRMSLCH